MSGLFRRAWNNLVSSVRSRTSEPGRARTRHFRPRLTALEDRTAPAVQVLESFSGLAFPDSNGPGSQGAFVPPDTTAAAGPNHVVHAVNNAVAIYNKNTGQRLLFQSAATFLGAGTVQGDLFDPVISYDEGVGRFYVVYLEENDANQTSELVIAVSNTSNPMQGFTERVSLNVRQTNAAGTNLWADFPIIGFNREAVVVTLNMFTFPSTTGTYDQLQVISIRKSTLLDRNPATIQTFSNTRPATNFTMAPAVMHNAPANSPMYFTQAPGNNQIRITRMTNVLTNAAGFVDTNVAVNAYTPPPNAPQIGGTLLFSSLNQGRASNAEWRGNQLVTAHTVGIGGEATARWYQFNVSAAPRLVQQGNVDPGVGIHTFYPSIALAPGGFIAMTYMQSSATTTMSMYATGRRPGNTLGTMPNNTLIRAGSRAYSDFAGAPFRIGDYSATAVDPVNGSFWVANEFATAAAQNNWGTWIANVLVPGQTPPVPPPPPPQPVVFPGVFVRNYTEPNDTSDRAAYLGTVTRGVNSMPGLKIVRNALGFPDYDWFHFRAQRNGRLTVTNFITSGQRLEMTLWRRVGDNLVLLGRVRTNNAGFSRLFANVRLGEHLYVGVQGVNFAPGRQTEASYNMQYRLR